MRRDSALNTSITDPEVLSFIEETEQLYDARPSRDIALERADYERMAQHFSAPLPTELAIEDLMFQGGSGSLPARRYWPKDLGPARVLYLHGGGYSLGSLESHASICADIAAKSGCEVVAATYRLAPEYPHPAAFHDALSAVDAFGDRPLVIVGDSAGGNLAAAVALEGDRRIVAQVLIYPDLGGLTRDLASYGDNAEARLLRTSDVIAYRRQRAGGQVPIADARFDPLSAADVAKAPPCFISVADHDPLRDDGAAFVLRLTDAGVPAEVVIEQELPHGHLRARHRARRANDAFSRICDAIRSFAAIASS
ncbi:MAG: alpha/beta hydrolase [Pseudomonadota bacterium]